MKIPSAACSTRTRKYSSGRTPARSRSVDTASSPPPHHGATVAGGGQTGGWARRPSDGARERQDPVRENSRTPAPAAPERLHWRARDARAWIDAAERRGPPRDAAVRGRLGREPLRAAPARLPGPH